MARKWVLERGWVQQGLFDIGWSDESECQACHKEKGTEKRQALLCHCPDWYEVRREIPGAVTENGKEGKSEMIASCGFLEDELRQYSKEGVTMADSVETLAVHLTNRSQEVGSERKSKKEEGQGEILAYQQE